jgi:hypothetical protein
MLSKVSRELKSAAERFLSSWGGDYKKASQDLFGNNKSVDK